MALCPETICEMNQKEENRSQPSSNILSRPFWNKKSHNIFRHCTAGCSNFVAWIRSRKILKWNSPKGAWSITSFSFLQHIFYNSSFKKIFPCWNFPRKWFSFDWQQSGAETEMSLSCTSFPSNQCHWVHSELPGAAEILKTESFALIFPLSMSPNMPTCPGHIGVKKLKCTVGLKSQ